MIPNFLKLSFKTSANFNFSKNKHNVHGQNIQADIVNIYCKDSPDCHLKPIVEEAMNDLQHKQSENGQLVFKRLRSTFEKEYGKLPEH